MENLQPVRRKKSTWYREQEVILQDWGEKAACYRWLHDRSQRKYRRQNLQFTIPVIILSTLAGTANFAIDGIFGSETDVDLKHKKYAGMIVGGVNLLCGMITTVQNFLRVAELNEAHRVQSVSWSKFQRNVAVELALKPDDRENVDDFIKICRAEFDRLMEQSPDIPAEIIKEFNKRFKGNPITKPEICDGLGQMKVYDDIQGRVEKTVANAGNILQNKLAKGRAASLRIAPKFEEKVNNEIANFKESESQKDINNELENLRNISKVKSINMDSLNSVLSQRSPERKLSFVENLKVQIEKEEEERKNETKGEITRKIEKELEDNVQQFPIISSKNMKGVINELKTQAEAEIELTEIVVNKEKESENVKVTLETDDNNNVNVKIDVKDTNESDIV